jgi:hypothetical protein
VSKLRQGQPSVGVPGINMKEIRRTDVTLVAALLSTLERRVFMVP